MLKRRYVVRYYSRQGIRIKDVGHSFTRRGANKLCGKYPPKERPHHKPLYELRIDKT